MCWHSARCRANKDLIGRIFSVVLISSWADGFVVTGCGLSDAALSDQIVQNSCCIWYTCRVAPRCVFSYVCWAHLTGWIPMCIPSHCICRASPLDQRERQTLVMLQNSLGQESWKWMGKKYFWAYWCRAGEEETGEGEWKRNRQRAAWAGRIRRKL